MTRCAYSDLPTASCAHCRGDHGVDVPIGDARRYQPDVPGAVVWPLPHVPPARRYPAPVEAPTDDPKVQVARDLRAILDMADMLGERAIDLAADPTIVGGMAMVALAPEADLEEWAELLARDELSHPARCRKSDHSECGYDWRAADEDDQDHEPPLQTLLFWSEQWRVQHGYPLEGRRPTIVTEAKLIGHLVDWAWDHEPHFEDFAADLTATRARMENLVRDGIRETRSRILCDRCREPKRLIRKWGKGERPDMWKAPCCKAELTDSEAKRAHARQMRSAGAERWVEINEAVAALRVQGWQERTVRRWLEPIHHSRDVCTDCGATWPAREYPACPAPFRRGDCGGFLAPVWDGNRDAVVEAWCDPVKHRTFVWWPSLWQRHLLAAHRREARMLARMTGV